MKVEKRGLVIEFFPLLREKRIKRQIRREDFGTGFVW